MAKDRSIDARASGYVLVFMGVMYAGMAVDRIFFHKTFGLRWLTAATAILCLAGGAWLIIKRRGPFDWIDDLAKERWGSRGKWLLTLVYVAVAVVITWLLSRLN